MDQVLTAAPWLELGEYAHTCRSSDHALDAVLCALVARAVPSAQRRWLATHGSTAALEGWIHFPTVPLEALVRSP